MRRLSIALLGLAATAAPAAADVLTGEVLRTEAAWRGGAIITTATVRTAAGDVQVEQLGGSADGLGMIVLHGDGLLEAGMRVSIDARPSKTDAARWIADEIRTAGGGRLPYVRTVTKKSGAPLYWAHSCVQIGYAFEGTTAIPGDEELAEIERILGIWNTAIASCSHQNFTSLGPVDLETNGRDFVTIVKFRDVEWCRPAAGGKDAYCHSHAAAGVTTVVFVDDPDDARDGEIVDADIELNNIDFAIAMNGVSGGSATCQADLANTLVHELGHVLGLEHTCRTQGERPRVDGEGRAVPLCSETTDPTIVDATMYPFQQCGETIKASLSADDVASMCEIYPIADGDGVCRAPDPLDGGCCSGTTGGTGALLGLATLGLLVAPRRRRRR